MKTTVGQAWADRLKILRAAVRLKYSIEADKELNWRIDVEQKKFYKAVQEGKMLAPLSPKKALDAEVA